MKYSSVVSHLVSSDVEAETRDFISCLPLRLFGGTHEAQEQINKILKKSLQVKPEMADKILDGILENPPSSNFGPGSGAYTQFLEMLCR